jgi:hypothetical protein
MVPGRNALNGRTEAARCVAPVLSNRTERSAILGYAKFKWQFIPILFRAE